MQSAQPIPCLLVPGLDGTGALFEPFAHALGSDFAIEIVRFDDGLGDFEAHVAAVAQALAQIAVPALVVAESFGGPVATVAAARSAGRVRALMLAATFVSRPTATVGLIAPPFRALAGVPWPSALRALVLNYCLGERTIDPELLARVVEVNGAPRARLLAHRLRIAAKIDVRDALARLPAPIGYVAGGGDRIVPVRAHAAEIRRLRPDAHVTMVPGAPHMVLPCRPQACAEAARALVRVAAAGASAGA